MTRLPHSLALALIFVCISCNSESSPTSPIAITQVPVTEANLAGTWTGNLTVMPGAEDWQSVRMTIRASGGVVTGEMQPRVGSVHQLTGSVSAGGAIIHFEDLPIDSPNPCFSLGLQLVAVETRGSEAIALIGRLGGRCPNTILSRDVRLERG